MSVEALAIALNHSRAKGTARLVLIGMANHDGDGGIWPSLDRLRRYAGGIDRRNVRRAVDRLVELGEVEVLVGEGGNRDTRNDQRPNLYRFLLTCPPDCDRTKWHNTPRGRRVEFQVSDVDDALELSTGPGEAYDGGALPPPRGGAVAPPETYLETTTKESASAAVRARPLCVDGSTSHAYSARTSACVYCGAPAPDGTPLGKPRQGRQRA